MGIESSSGDSPRGGSPVHVYHIERAYFQVAPSERGRKRDRPGGEPSTEAVGSSERVVSSRSSARDTVTRSAFRPYVRPDRISDLDVRESIAAEALGALRKMPPPGIPPPGAEPHAVAGSLLPARRPKAVPARTKVPPASVRRSTMMPIRFASVGPDLRAETVPPSKPFVPELPARPTARRCTLEAPRAPALDMLAGFCIDRDPAAIARGAALDSSGRLLAERRAALPSLQQRVDYLGAQQATLLRRSQQLVDDLALYSYFVDAFRGDERARIERRQPDGTTQREQRPPGGPSRGGRPPLHPGTGPARAMVSPVHLPRSTAPTAEAVEAALASAFAEARRHNPDFPWRAR